MDDDMLSQSEPVIAHGYLSEEVLEEVLYSWVSMLTVLIEAGHQSTTFQTYTNI